MREGSTTAMGRQRNKPNRKSRSFSEGRIPNKKLSPSSMAIRPAASNENLASKQVNNSSPRVSNSSQVSNSSNQSTPSFARKRKSSKANIPLAFTQFNAQDKILSSPLSNSAINAHFTHDTVDSLTAHLGNTVLK